MRRKPFAILRYLLEHSGQLITKHELLGQLWPNEYVGEGVLKTYLSEIRRALGDSAQAPQFIETAQGRGYRFIGMLQDLAPSSGAPSSAPRLPAATCSASDEPTSFVGRLEALRFLQQAFESANAGRRRIVFVTGEAGIGKTLLVERFLERAAVHPATLVAWGQCVDQYGAGEPYLPFLEAIGRCARGLEGAHVLDLLREHAATWLTLLPSVARAADATPPERAIAPERLMREMAELLEALTQQRLLILWIEDLHWADPSTLVLLSYLARRGDPARLLVLATYRADEAREAERLAVVEEHLRLREPSSELHLSYLDGAEIAAYLASRFAGHAFPAAFAPLLHRLTGGNPLFMARLVDFWLEQGVIASAPEGWRLGRELTRLGVDIPNSLTRMIERDIESQGDFERSVLEAASVAGVEFGSTAVAVALGQDITRVEALCTRWSRRGKFLRLHGGAEWPDGTVYLRYEFIHAAYRHVIYAQLGVARQAQLHQRVGTRLEIAHAAALREVASELAMHFERGQDLARAVRYLRLAADHALQRSAYREASEHLQKALQLLPKLRASLSSCELELELDLCLAFGSALTVLRGYAHPEVEAIYGRARELCQGLGDSPELASVLSGIGGFFIIRAQYLEGAQLCEQSLAVAERCGDEEAIVAARLGLGFVEVFHGDLGAAREHLEGIVQGYAPGRHRVHILQFKQDPSVVATCFLGHALAWLGYCDRALQLTEECLAFARRLGDPVAVAFALLGLGYVRRFRGDYEVARELAQQLIELSREHGFTLHEAIGALAYGEAAVGCGQLEEGIRLICAGLEGYRMTGAEVGVTYWQAQLVEAYLRAGDTAAAWQTLERAIHDVQRLDERHWEAELHRLRGELLEQTRAPAALSSAEDSLMEALRVARQRREKSLELRAATSLARLWLSRGNTVAGHQLLTEAYASLTEGFETLDLRKARALLGQLVSA